MVDDNKIDEIAEEPKKPKRKKYIPVKLITSKGKIMIVEWLDGGTVQRGILPAVTKIKDGKIEETVLNTAIYYGVPWDEFVPDEFDPQKLSEELHKKGIWTHEDAKNNLHQFGQVLLSVIGVTRNELLSFAKKFENTK